MTAGLYLGETVDAVANLQLSDESNLSYVTQTTLSVDDTKNIIDNSDGIDTLIM